MILRDQKSWSGRSAIERLFWTTDNSIELVSSINDWAAVGGDVTSVARPESLTPGPAHQSSGFESSEDPFPNLHSHDDPTYNWSLTQEAALWGREDHHQASETTKIGKISSGLMT